MGGSVAAGAFAFLVLALAAGGLMFGFSILSLLLAKRSPQAAVAMGAVSLVLCLVVMAWVLWDPWKMGVSFILGGLAFAGVPGTAALAGIVRARREILDGGSP